MNDCYSCMIFKINNVFYSLPIDTIVEVLPFSKYETPVKLQKYSLGLMNYNGLLLNVVDLISVLGINVQNYSLLSKMMVIKTEESMFVIVVDDITDIKNVKQSDFQMIPYTSKHFITSVFEDKGNIVSLLNVDAIEKEVKQNKDNLEEIVSKINFDKNEMQIWEERGTKIKNKADSLDMIKYQDYQKYILFLVDGVTFCINILDVKEIIDLSSVNITKIRSQSSCLEGVVSFRGDFISVINFSRFIGGNTNFDMSAKLILLDVDDYKIALLVAEICEIISVFNEEEVPVNENADLPPFIEYQYIRNEDILFILNVKKMIANKLLFINE